MTSSAASAHPVHLVFALLLFAVAAAACGTSGPSPIVVAPREAASPVPWTGISASTPILGGEEFGGPGNQYTFDAVAFGMGFVVVGEDFRSDGDVRGRVWHSGDGTAWSAINEPADAFANSELDHVATTGLRLVAIGSSRDGGQNARPRPLVWLSDDGTTWRRSELGTAAFAAMSVGGIAGGQDGFVEWGAGGAGQAEILASSDGEHWTVSGFSGDFSNASISDVTDAGGLWVAVGTERAGVPQTGGPARAAKAWFSADGLHWSAAAIDGPALGRVFAGTAGFLATGGATCGSCVGPGNLWHSETGTSWRLIGPEPADNASYAAAGGRIVRLSTLNSISLAASTDGLVWTALASNLALHSEYGAFAIGQQGVVLLENPEVNGGESDQVDAGVWYLPAS
jgi:hypothetical protein